MSPKDYTLYRIPEENEETLLKESSQTLLRSCGTRKSLSLEGVLSNELEKLKRDTAWVKREARLQRYYKDDSSSSKKKTNLPALSRTFPKNGLYMKSYDGRSGEQCRDKEKNLHEPNSISPLRDKMYTSTKTVDRNGNYLMDYSYDHQGHQMFPCLKCDKTFKYKRNLKTHVVAVHSRFVSQDSGYRSLKSEELFMCSICLSIFKYSANLRAHMLVHERRR